MKTYANRRRDNHNRAADGRHQAVNQSGVGPAAACVEGRTAAACAALPRTATGLLIPRLAAGVPVNYVGDDESKHVVRWVTELRNAGVLNDNDGGQSELDVVEQGLARLRPPSLAIIDDYIRIMLGKEISVGVGQDCHSWRMRLEPILNGLSFRTGLEFITDLNDSQVQGPWFWNELLGFDEDSDVSREWLEQLQKNYPALAKFNAPPLPEFDRQDSPELLALVKRLKETSAAVGKYTDSGALLTTSWNRGCPIDHAHDWVVEAIQDGSIDGQDADTFAFTAGSIAELKGAFAVIGDFVEAATKLEEWSNAR